jgi:transglutaminase-like putative cysteine protease
MANPSSFNRFSSRSLFQRIQRQIAKIEAISPTEVEDSLLLRILTQALVLVGIVATDVAAETEMSSWAIPLSIAGATWSWYSRRRPNVAVKFAIAILMLLALGAFFAGLWRQLNDTRLVLAELLVQLQVLHSFDLPRRKDLGYSMVIGLILLGVASTLSQTMGFGLLLLVFLAIALPVLLLDYRSRLGLVASGLRLPLKQSGLSVKQLIGFLLAVLVLGLGLFAIMPRLPGYQLQTFPVSAPIQRDFNDSTEIINPGYVRTGDASRGSGTGRSSRQGQEGGPGVMDEEFYYGFNQRINQNLRGQMKPKVVMRVRSQAEGFWRVLAFDRYLGQGWEISRNQAAKTVERSSWSYQFFLPRSPSLAQKKEVVQTYTVVAELPNLIPALAQAKVLYFPTRQIAIDPEGNLRSPLELLEGLTYTVISDVPYRDRTQLQQTSSRYPVNIQKYYLEVPDAIRDKVRQKTEAMLARSPQPITAPYEKALFLAQELKQRYTIQPDLPFLKQNEDLVETFLFKYEGGYPDHFATTLAIMLRSIGIPARLAVGFRPGEFNPFTGLYVVRNTDAHAITEVYFPNFGWWAFDPIPGHELIPPSVEEDQTFTVLQRFWQWVAGWLPSPLTSLLNQVFGAIAGWLARLLGWFLGLLTKGWLGILTALITAIATGFLGWLSWQGWRYWRYHYWLSRLPAMEQLYQQMLNQLAHRGYRKQPSQTPLEYGQQVSQTQPPEQAVAIQGITHAYVHWRYGGTSPDLALIRRLLKTLTPSWRQRLRRKPASSHPVRSLE